MINVIKVKKNTQKSVEKLNIYDHIRTGLETTTYLQKKSYFYFTCHF